MKNTVCVTLFKALSENEVKAFGNYLATFYQKSGSVFKLYTYLKKYHPDLTNEKLDRKYVEKKLFGENANPERTLFDSTSNITGKLKSFITIQELEKQDVYKNFLYLEALKSRKLDALFFKKAESLQRSWDDDVVPGIEHFHNQYKLKVINYSHPNFSNQKMKKASELKNIINLLDQYYATIKMYYTLINNINNKETVKEKYSVSKVLKNFDNATLPNKTKLLYSFLQAFQSNKLDDFKEIKSVFFALHNQFTQSEKHDIASILHYLFYSKRNESHIYDELFQITKFSLKEDLLLEDGYLTAQSYINCILTAKANNEIEWIELFKNNYNHLLNGKIKYQCILFGDIILHIERREFDMALEKLALIKLKIPIRVAQLNCCRLQCLYEMEYEMAFQNALNAAKQYLLNHKKDFSKTHLITFQSFIKTIKEIYKLRAELKFKPYQKSIHSLNMLHNFLDEENSTYDKKWLSLKVQEIINKLN